MALFSTRKNRKYKPPTTGDESLVKPQMGTTKPPLLGVALGINPEMKKKKRQNLNIYGS